MTALAAVLFAATFTRTMERVRTMDPAQCQSMYESHAMRLVYESPLTVDYAARPYRLAPCFCELPDVSADALTYVFRVRGGRPAARVGRLGAVDLARSLERLRDPKAVTPNGWIMKDVDTVRATDANTVEIRLKRRCHFFPWLMIHPSASAVGPHGEGSGAFRLARWRKNHEMVFERKDEGSGRQPGTAFDTVRYLVVDDVSTQWLMFLRGEIDFLGEIARDNFDAVMNRDGTLDPSLARAGVKLHFAPSLDILHIGFNMRDPVLGPNRPLRQALNAAFDYPAWEKFYNGRIVPADGPVPRGVAGRLETPFPYAFDLAKAKRLMAAAGYPDGIDPKTGRRLALTMTIGRASQESREAGELLAAFYERIGIRLELAFMTWDAFLKAVNEGRVQMFRMGWVGDYPDAQNFLQLFYSKNVNPGPNHANYANPAYDRAYEAALAAETETDRNRHWATCQEIVREDCPWVFTHGNKSFTLVRPTVENYVPGDFTYGAEEFFRVGRTESR